MLHPFLQNDFHIKWVTLTLEHIETDIGKALDEAQSAEMLPQRENRHLLIQIPLLH